LAGLQAGRCLGTIFCTNDFLLPRLPTARRPRAILRRRCRALISAAGAKVGRRWDGLCVGLRRAVRPFRWTRTPRAHTGLDLAKGHFLLPRAILRRRCRALISGAGPKVGRRWDGLCVGLRRAVRPFRWTRTPRAHTGLDLAIFSHEPFCAQCGLKPIWRVCVHAGFDQTAPNAPRAQSTHPCGSRTARDLVHIKPLRSNGLPNMARGSPKTMKVATIAGLHRPKRALDAPLSAPHARPVAKARPRARQGGRVGASPPPHPPPPSIMAKSGLKPIWRACALAGFDATAPNAPATKCPHPRRPVTARDSVSTKPFPSNGLANMAKRAFF